MDCLSATRRWPRGQSWARTLRDSRGPTDQKAPEAIRVAQGHALVGVQKGDHLWRQECTPLAITDRRRSRGRMLLVEGRVAAHHQGP